MSLVLGARSFLSHVSALRLGRSVRQLRSGSVCVIEGTLPLPWYVGRLMFSASGAPTNSGFKFPHKIFRGGGHH